VAPRDDGSLLDRLRVVFSFVLIFAFSSIDSAISPMVESLHLHFGVPLDSVLLLISSATTGIVLGVIAGPALTASLRVSRLLAAGAAGLVAAHALFLLAPGFHLALACRFLFGLS
jgi:predicted MFS family arabinose efflux permease